MKSHKIKLKIYFLSNAEVNDYDEMIRIVDILNEGKNRSLYVDLNPELEMMKPSDLYSEGRIVWIQNLAERWLEITTGEIGAYNYSSQASSIQGILNYYRTTHSLEPYQILAQKGINLLKAMKESITSKETFNRLKELLQGIDEDIDFSEM